MEAQLKLIGIQKSFRHNMLFRQINYTFSTPNAYAIIGPNGSGKSTLLKIISGKLPPAQGKVVFYLNEKLIPFDQLYRYMDFVAPYCTLFEYLTLNEQVKLHFQFKKLTKSINSKDLLSEIGLLYAKDTPVNHLSSGMLQKLQLALALYSDAPILLLDEPSVNLDEKNKAWFQEQMNGLIGKKLIIMGSNVAEEYQFCNEKLSISEYKL